MNLKMFHFFTLRKSKRGRRSNDITVLNFLRAFHQTLGTHKWSIILAKIIDGHSLLQKQMNVVKIIISQRKFLYFFIFLLRFKTIRRHSNLLWHELLIFCTINQINDKAQNMLLQLILHKICYANKKTVMI